MKNQDNNRQDKQCLDMDEKAITRFYSAMNLQDLKGHIVGLVGSLGAGKTHLVKSILSGLLTDSENQVTSPTFNLCNIYKTSDLEIFHFDLYRIESEDELYNIGIWESLENGNALVFIEWVDLFPELAEMCHEIITISMDDDSRKYKLEEV